MILIGWLKANGYQEDRSRRKNLNDKVAPSDQFVNNEKIEKFLTPKNFRKFLIRPK